MNGLAMRVLVNRALFLVCESPPHPGPRTFAALPLLLAAEQSLKVRGLMKLCATGGGGLRRAAGSGGDRGGPRGTESLNVRLVFFFFRQNKPTRRVGAAAAGIRSVHAIHDEDGAGAEGRLGGGWQEVWR